MQAAHQIQYPSYGLTPPPEVQNDIVTTRRLLWLYCLLWLFEGALRKWVLPQYSLALLLIRDPVVLVVYYYAVRARVFPSNGWMAAFWGVSAILLLQSFVHLFTSGMPPDVVAFGFRTFVLHMPLIWVVPAVVGRREIVLVGKWVLYLAPFLAALMVVQFQMPLDHWLNAASLKGGAQIGSSMGKVRPPGFFSFIQGPINFFALCTAFIIAGFLHPKVFPRWLMAVGIVSTLAALSVSGSRGLLLSCFAVCAFGTLAVIRSGKRIGGAFGVAIGVVAAVAILSQFQVMRLGREIMMERWTSVGNDEQRRMTGSEAMVGRYGGIFASAAHWAAEAPLFGYGCGSTSNFAQDRTGYSPPVETEWERVVYEMGPLTSSFYLFFRAAFAAALVVWGYQALRAGNYFALVLASACAFDMLAANFRQVTSMGFTAVCSGLTLAALKAFGPESSETDTEQAAAVVSGEPFPLDPLRPRGRGRFAVGGDRVPS